MDIKELESFKLSDAVKFHDELNPKLWSGKDLHDDVYNALAIIAKDFITELGLSGLNVEDITISGSNAAYSYTPHSDLDLHLLVDFNKLPNNDVYQELFTAKKNDYNKSHDLTIKGVPVELYVQDSNQPHVSLGEYSLLNKDWIKFPVKKKANFDQANTKAKYEKLGELIELALRSESLEDIEHVLDIVKRYRKAGLTTTGEFGPENLAFKALRKQGYIQQLWDKKQELHSKKLSLEDYDINGVAEGGAETSWSDGNEKITLQDILELTKHIKQIDLPINDNLKSKLIHWDGNPEEIERINQVTVSNQFPILVMLDKQGQIDWILDGNHRLHKAIKSQAKTIPAKLIKPSDLDDRARRVFHINESKQKVIEGTNCKNCVWWKKDSEKPVGKDELNSNGGLKPPNKEYIAMSKRVDLVTLPGKDTVKVKGFCYHKDINDWVTERMCCAKWDAKGVIRDYKGESPLMEEELEEASGYIPSEKEKNDPRFKTALTIDVKPDSILKNAKAFGFKTSRAGIPPQAKTNGKI